MPPTTAARCSTTSGAASANSASITERFRRSYRALRGTTIAAGSQPASALYSMRMLYAVLPFAGSLAAALLVNRYSLSENRIREIKGELERRRSEPQAVPDSAEVYA